ncbi:hypothetical protein [Lactobacillus bombicola]|jgi:ABC-2 type transport system permease protein|uniref:ABC-2 type transport system permease protein n=1 Tax=Lactobacillus bombicola TaxID=1505723 RepID=A0ABX9LXK6_9LACO|nr:hypothetical protein [Lactobacillus bombicola]RHW49026.1 hypothetical protein DS833_05855 [Lactobacillus bombicola]RHW53528.1 hypothetical protein DS834_00905 [Lactobacillus bombicola]
MKKRFYSLYKIFLINSFSNKIALMFNIIFPVIYFAISNAAVLTNNYTVSKNQLISGSAYYFSYIALTTILNSVILAMIEYRDYGYYKIIYMVSNSKYLVLISQFLSQWTFLIVELFLFNLITTLFFRSFAYLGYLLVTTTIAAIVLVLPLTMGLYFLLTVKLKLQTYSIVNTLIVFGSFMLVTVETKNNLLNLLLLCTPIKYLMTGYEVIMQFLFYKVNLNALINLLIVIVFYVLLGIIFIAKQNISTIFEK